jgi:hypothetical protein
MVVGDRRTVILWMRLWLRSTLWFSGIGHGEGERGTVIL